MARKEGEGTQLKHSLSLSPERFRMKSAGSSPLHPSRGKSAGDLSSGRKQPTEDIGNIEVRTCASKEYQYIHRSILFYFFSLEVHLVLPHTRFANTLHQSQKGEV